MVNKSRGKSIYKRALTLAIPMMIQSAIANAVGLVDNVMVGSLGSEGITAVSIVGQLYFVFSLGIFGALSGPGIYGAQYYGQGNKKEFQNVFRLKIWAVAIIGIIGVALMYFFCDGLIGLYMKGNSENINKSLALALGADYLYIRLIGMVPFLLTQVYAGSLRETGESILPMTAGIVSVFVDIALNYTLIYGNFGMPRLEVKGAAIATVFAQFIECLIILIGTHLSKTKEYMKGLYQTIIIPIRKMDVIVKKSVPIFFNEFLWAGGMAMLTQCYSVRGLDVVAGMNISNAICNLLNVVFIALGSAIGILSGHMLGASKFDEAKSNAVKFAWFTGGISCVLSLVLILISGIFPSFYNTSENIKYFGKMFIILTACFFPIQGMLNSLYFTLRSGGKTFITFLFDSVFTWCCPIVVAVIMCYFTNVPVLTVFVIVNACDVIKIMVGYILIKKGVWINNLVEE